MSRAGAAENAALAKDKLVEGQFRGRELERLEELLGDEESVVTMAQALFRSEAIERRGLVVLTDSRLVCVDQASQDTDTLQVALAGITSVETSVTGGSGNAARGELSITSDGVRTEVLRIHPWERAGEIADYVNALAA